MEKFSLICIIIQIICYIAIGIGMYKQYKLFEEVSNELLITKIRLGIKQTELDIKDMKIKALEEENKKTKR